MRFAAVVLCFTVVRAVATCQHSECQAAFNETVTRVQSCGYGISGGYCRCDEVKSYQNALDGICVEDMFCGAKAVEADLILQQCYCTVGAHDSSFETHDCGLRVFVRDNCSVTCAKGFHAPPDALNTRRCDYSPAHNVVAFVGPHVRCDPDHVKWPDGAIWGWVVIVLAACYCFSRGELSGRKKRF